jgi:hypothetical protein
MSQVPSVVTCQILAGRESVLCSKVHIDFHTAAELFKLRCRPGHGVNLPKSALVNFYRWRAPGCSLRDNNQPALVVSYTTEDSGDLPQEKLAFKSM